VKVVTVFKDLFGIGCRMVFD